MNRIHRMNDLLNPTKNRESGPWERRSTSGAAPIVPEKTGEKSAHQGTVYIICWSTDRQYNVTTARDI